MPGAWELISDNAPAVGGDGVVLHPAVVSTTLRRHTLQA